MSALKKKVCVFVCFHQKHYTRLFVYSGFIRKGRFAKQRMVTYYTNPVNFKIYNALKNKNLKIC